MKKIIAAVSLCLFATSVFTGVAQGTVTPKPASYTNQIVTSKKFVPNKLSKVLKVEKVNIYGSSTPEKIVFYQQEDKNGLPLYWSLVVNGCEKVRLNNDVMYSRAEYKLLDLGRDKLPEVLIYRYCTGSSGAVGLNIYRPAPTSFKEIFVIQNNVDFSKMFLVKYTGNYEASFIDKQSSLTATIPLEKSRYTGIENYLKNISTWVDPVADYKLIDTDGDKVKEIVAVQRICGVSHADTIALLQTIYKQIDGKYKAVAKVLLTDQNKLIKKVSLTNKPAAPSGGNQGITTNKMPYEVVGYNALPQTIKDKILKQEITGSTLVVKDGDNQYIYIGLGQRPTGGYSVKIQSCEDVEGRISVVYSEISPAKNAILTQALTYPYLVIKVALPLPVTITNATGK